MAPNYLKAEFIQDEILNIEYHTVNLILKSLNSSSSIKNAADKCGISRSTLQNYMKNYEIVFDDRRDQYIKNRNTLIKVYTSI